MSNNFFTICSLFYIILLNVVYFCKKRANNYETKIYSALVVVSLLTNVFAIANYFTIINSDSIPMLNIVVSKLLLVCFIGWGFFFTSYNYMVSVKKTKGEKKYNNIKKYFFIVMLTSYLIVFLCRFYMNYLYFGQKIKSWINSVTIKYIYYIIIS